MRRDFALAAGLAAALPVFATAAGTSAQHASMTFFVTSTGPGKGADLGGLAGADRHCQQLAQATGAGSRTWRAYLSVTAAGGAPAVNARDRIGQGPWRNAKGAIVAKSVKDLHGPESSLTKQTALNEKGEPVNGRGDEPNMHDILTGSQPDGRAFPPGEQRHHLRELDQERRRLCRGGPSRPPRPARRRRLQVVELCARHARLQFRCPRDDGRCRTVLLLRCGLGIERGNRKRGAGV